MFLYYKDEKKAAYQKCSSALTLSVPPKALKPNSVTKKAITEKTIVQKPALQLLDLRKMKPESTSQNTIMDDNNIYLKASVLFLADIHPKTKALAVSKNVIQIIDMDYNELSTLLLSNPSRHSDASQQLHNYHVRQFEFWRFQIDSGFNLLLHGYGSKIKIASQFCRDYCDDGICISIKGFNPTATSQGLMTTILDHFYKQSKHDGDYRANPSRSDQMKIIKHLFAGTIDKMYILIHNIDGINLRNLNQQTILSELASISNIHMIATIDNVSSPRLWDYTLKTRYNWISHHVPTFESYVTEITAESSNILP